MNRTLQFLFDCGAAGGFFLYAMFTMPSLDNPAIYVAACVLVNLAYVAPGLLWWCWVRQLFNHEDAEKHFKELSRSMTEENHKLITYLLKAMEDMGGKLEEIEANTLASYELERSKK